MTSPVESLSATAAPPPVYGWRRLCFTCEGHLDLSWLLALGYFALGVAGTYRELTIVDVASRPSKVWWAWLAGQSVMVLIAAVPIAKARLLARVRDRELALAEPRAPIAEPVTQ